MKLLVVSNMYPSKEYPSYGVFVKNFTEQLEELNIDYRLAVMHKASGKLQKLFGYAGFFLKSFLLSLFGSYDAVYVHYASHSSPGVLLARKFRKFTVYTNCHGSDVIPENPGQEKMQKNTRQILARSEKIIVPSEYFKRVVAEKYDLPLEKLFVCASGGVNTDIFFPKEAMQTRPFTMGFVGRLSYGKGWQTFLQACGKLPDRDWRIVMVGDGPEKERMLSMLDALQLQGVTTLHGLLPQAELANVYRNIDVFVFPTERQGESLGLVAVEAMACGCPVLASDFAAPADYVADGINGYKFPVGNSEELAKRIEKMRSASEIERTVLREGALATAQQYSRQQVTQTLKKILLE